MHEMYGQAFGERLFADAQQLPGFVTGAYARPKAGEPFRLPFSGQVPDELAPRAYDLNSFGLEASTGAAGFDHEAFAVAFEASREVGMQPVSSSGDEAAGNGRIEVIDATPGQLAAWEQAVEDPSRWCLVQAPRTVACDDTGTGFGRPGATPPASGETVRCRPHWRTSGRVSVAAWDEDGGGLERQPGRGRPLAGRGRWCRW